MSFIFRARNTRVQRCNYIIRTLFVNSSYDHSLDLAWPWLALLNVLRDSSTSISLSLFHIPPAQPYFWFITSYPVPNRSLWNILRVLIQPSYEGYDRFLAPFRELLRIVSRFSRISITYSNSTIRCSRLDRLLNFFSHCVYPSTFGTHCHSGIPESCASSYRTLISYLHDVTNAKSRNMHSTEYLHCLNSFHLSNPLPWTLNLPTPKIYPPYLYVPERRRVAFHNFPPNLKFELRHNSESFHLNFSR